MGRCGGLGEEKRRFSLPDKCFLRVVKAFINALQKFLPVTTVYGRKK